MSDLEATDPVCPIIARPGWFRNNSKLFKIENGILKSFFTKTILHLQSRLCSPHMA